MAASDKIRHKISGLDDGLELDPVGLPENERVEELGETAPTTKLRVSDIPAAPGTGFQCQRPGCHMGSHARQLPAPPTSDAFGKQIYEKVCADCWREWLGMGVKVINEMRLDLSDERSQQVYDNYMKEFLGLT